MITTQGIRPCCTHGPDTVSDNVNADLAGGAVVVVTGVVDVVDVVVTGGGATAVGTDPPHPANSSTPAIPNHNRVTATR